MATFRVGMRVRVNRPQSANHGKETVVTAVGVKGVYDGDWFVGVEVNLPCTGSIFHDLCVFKPHDLEPILPQHEPCEEWFRTCDLDALLQREAVRA